MRKAQVRSTTFIDWPCTEVMVAADSGFEALKAVDSRRGNRARYLGKQSNFQLMRGCAGPLGPGMV